MGHSRLSPSRANQWVNCPGSITMQEKCPKPPESQAAREGTAAHWLAEQVLLDKEPGSVAPNGVEINDEMREAVSTYTNGILTRFPRNALTVERKVKAPCIHPELWGTLDLMAYDSKTHTIIIDDFKYGRGAVDAFENWQMMCYAAGLVDLADFRLRVRFEIWQPRLSDNPSVWEVKAVDLRPYINRLHNAAHEALSDSPKVKTGSHCIYCSARASCPAISKSAASILDLVDQASVDELTPDALSNEITVLRYAADLLTYRLTGLEAQATGLLQSGKFVPGYAIEPGPGREVWAKPLEEVFALGEMLGVNLKKKEAITPKQAVKAGIPADFVKQYSTINKSALKLVPVNKTLAYKIFGGN